MLWSLLKCCLVHFGGETPPPNTGVIITALFDNQLVGRKIAIFSCQKAMHANKHLNALNQGLPFFFELKIIVQG